MKLKGKPRWEASKTIFWGLVLTTIFFVFWLSLVGNPFSDYALMIKGVQVNGHVDSCVQDYAESDSGNGGPFQDCTYTFNVNGRTFGGRDAFPQSTSEGEAFGIVYLPENPETHKKNFTIASGILDFIFRKVLLAIGLLIMFVAAGVRMTWIGIRNFYRNVVSND